MPQFIPLYFMSFHCNGNNGLIWFLYAYIVVCTIFRFWRALLSDSYPRGSIQTHSFLSKPLRCLRHWAYHVAVASLQFLQRRTRRFKFPAAAFAARPPTRCSPLVSAVHQVFAACMSGARPLFPDLFSFSRAQLQVCYRSLLGCGAAALFSHIYSAVLLSCHQFSCSTTVSTVAPSTECIHSIKLSPLRPTVFLSRRDCYDL